MTSWSYKPERTAQTVLQAAGTREECVVSSLQRAEVSGLLCHLARALLLSGCWAEQNSLPQDLAEGLQHPSQLNDWHVLSSRFLVLHIKNGLWRHRIKSTLFSGRDDLFPSHKIKVLMATWPCLHPFSLKWKPSFLISESPQRFLLKTWQDNNLIMVTWFYFSPPFLIKKYV